MRRRHRRARRGARPAAPVRNAAGFTLLEVMLALAILGIVATAVYGSFSRTLRSKGIAEERAEITRSGRAALGHMADEIAAAFYPTPKPAGVIFRSLAGGTESTPFDALVFSALSLRPSGSGGRDSDQRVISYFFPEPERRMGGRAPADDAEDFFAAFGRTPIRAPGAEPQRLLRRETVLTAPAATTSVPPTLFLDDVASLKLRFHDGNEWLDAWDSEDRVNYRPLPRAVAIDLALYDASGEIHHFATAVDLPLADPRPGPRREPGASPSPRPSGPGPRPTPRGTDG